MVCLVLDKGKKNDDGLSYKPDVYGKHVLCAQLLLIKI